MTLIYDRLISRITAANIKYGMPSSAHESLGVLTEEMDELRDAVHRNNCKDVMEEALDIAAAAVRLADACMGPTEPPFHTRSGFNGP